ncbi:MAG: YibE/F family protein, partial [Spirochaetales bacterium]|nr:YibE/F family protein [Spirochaetales bacterium]
MIKDFRTLITLIASAAITIILIFLVKSLPYNQYKAGMSGATVDYEVAKVIEVSSEKLQDSHYQKDLLTGSQSLQVKLMTGEHRGEIVSADNHLSTYNSVVGKLGRYLIVVVDKVASGEFQVRVYNYFRAPAIYLIAVLFFASLILVGQKKGLMSGIGLIYTFVCVFTIFLPLVLRGYSPVLSAIVLVVLVSAVTLILLNGVSIKSLCCILGTILGVI